MFSEKRERRTGPECPCCDFMQKQREVIYPEHKMLSRSFTFHKLLCQTIEFHYSGNICSWCQNPEKVRGPWQYPRCISLHFQLRHSNGTFPLKRNKTPSHMFWQAIKQRRWGSCCQMQRSENMQMCAISQGFSGVKNTGHTVTLTVSQTTQCWFWPADSKNL